MLDGVSINCGMGCMAGVLIIGSLNNGMILVDVSGSIRMVVKGIVLVITVGMNCISRKRHTT